MKRTLAIILVLAAGCKSAPETPPPPPPVEEPPAAEVVWSVPITWGGDIPMVDSKVRDGQTKFVVSTSSSYHTLTKTFATTVRAPVSTTRKTTKVHGVSADVERVEGVVSVTSSDAQWRLQDVVASDSQALDPRGVGGFLVPQRLTSNTEHVVLDFPGSAVTLVAGNPDLFAEWFTGKFGEAKRVPMHRDEDGLLYVDATIADGDTRRVLLDSGVARTRLSADALGTEVEGGACVSGADLLVECLPGVEATVDSVEFAGDERGPVEAIAIANPPAGADGALGMDVLRNCVIAIGVGNQAYMVCD